MLDFARELHRTRRRYARLGTADVPSPRHVHSRDVIPAGWFADEALNDFYSTQPKLLSRGTIVWGALIQANNELFTLSPRVRPAEFVASIDAHFDANPDRLADIAQAIYALKGTTPSDPDLRLVADRITDEYYRCLAEPLPKKITGDHAARRFTIPVFPKHLPHGFLSGSIAPLLVERGTSFSMVLPHWYWSRNLLELWAPDDEDWHDVLSNDERPLLEVTEEALDTLSELYYDINEHPDTCFIRLTIHRNFSIALDSERQPGDESITIDGFTFLMDAQTVVHHAGCLLEFDSEDRAFFVE